jgi:ABC-type multidrug transport system fused ATPase/permease subunit
MQALKLARLDAFVAQLPLGLDSIVGDNGAQLSGGERQRLGLARAILRGGTLLLLDEATSALDEENERAILEGLVASGRTVLLATHRGTSHVFADRVLRIEDGRLIEEPGRNLATAPQKITAGAME